jgi:hypothetical protein
METFLRWLPMVILVVQGLMAWALWSLKQQFVSRTECAGCKDGNNNRVTRSENRLSELEGDVHALPARSELQTLGDKIEKLTEKLGHVDGRLTGINRAVDLLNQHHLRVNG